MAAHTTSLKKRKKQYKSHRAVTAALIGTGVALLGVYIGFGIYYKGHFFPKTSIGGIACGNKTDSYVESENIDNARNYVLTITDRKGSHFELAGTDFGYTYDANGEEAALLRKQNGFLWPIAIFQTHVYDLNRSFSYDVNALTEQIQALPLFDEDYIEPPQDAHLNITEDGYEIIDEVGGNTPIPDTMTAEITAAVDDQKTSILLSDKCYENPAVCASDSIIADTAAQIDKYTAATIHYDIDGADENLDKGTILSFLDIGEDGTVTVNDNRVTQFVQRLASTYNTYGDVRKFKTSKGDTVKIGGGDYGWVINKVKEKDELLKDLEGGIPVEREPMYEQRALQSGLDDIGNTYIEIDYTNQHLWYYKEGELVTDTDIVSGNISRGNGSPDGVFKIVYLQRDATLIGENYASDVKYFMPFAYNVGIHDASWRNTFGKEIYKTSGSHGCINVPEKKAKKLFQTVETGTPVIAYYRDPVTLTAENARISNAYSYKEPDKK